ncbi:PLP-dependent aminotransferase family protein [Luteipulveratus mongoliensis]|uniref:GntR family transcriptional regulator n=1 Tax=Luteipulveratus mongoliensis TaxID=571913 RepID=A0A0K1JE16_9MICO|nr:PLP-dependent aminotransferase family protein [Luteipulveratus mongoliensis]AKU14830.1 GntR family transcriptional regulator [Luteipulveratus mongoliensis]
MAARKTTQLASDLLVELDRAGAEPMHRQIESAIRDRIRTGGLPLGTSVPASRSLAADLGVSRGVVVEAYQQLVAEGYLASTPGGYTRVAAGPGTPTPAPTPEARPSYVVDFGYGRSDVASFPRAVWLRSLRRVLTEAPNDRLGYLSGNGMLELREGIADYLNRVRGTCADPETVVITAGYAQASHLLMAVLAARGARVVVVEDPSANDDVRPLADAHGIKVIGVPVDDDGLRDDALANVEADAIILTPSHQWPTGGVLTAERRAAVIEWARSRDALVIEDDYDAEYRYDRTPLGAMQGLAPDVVAYAGSSSKTLAPGLRVGWLILPPDLVGPVAEAKVLADRGAPAIDQLAFADFLQRGELDRHLRRMRPVYRTRRDVLLAALAEHLPDLEPTGIAAGLHVVTWLPDHLDEDVVVEAAARAGVHIVGLRPYRLSPGRGGLIFGYSNLNERAIVQGVRLLAQSLVE